MINPASNAANAAANNPASFNATQPNARGSESVAATFNQRLNNSPTINNNVLPQALNNTLTQLDPSAVQAISPTSSLSINSIEQLDKATELWQSTLNDANGTYQFNAALTGPLDSGRNATVQVENGNATFGFYEGGKEVASERETFSVGDIYARVAEALRENPDNVSFSVNADTGFPEFVAIRYGDEPDAVFAATFDELAPGRIF